MLPGEGWAAALEHVRRTHLAAPTPWVSGSEAEQAPPASSADFPATTPLALSRRRSARPRCRCTAIKSDSQSLLSIPCIVGAVDIRQGSARIDHDPLDLLVGAETIGELSPLVPHLHRQANPRGRAVCEAHIHFQRQRHRSPVREEYLLAVLRLAY